MSTTSPELAREGAINRARLHELVQQGELIYRTQLKAQLEKSNLHQYVAIEPASGDYFVGKTMSDAGFAAQLAYPDRLTHMIRIGHEVSVEIGSGQ